MMRLGMARTQPGYGVAPPMALPGVVPLEVEPRGVRGGDRPPVHPPRQNGPRRGPS